MNKVSGKRKPAHRLHDYRDNSCDVYTVFEVANSAHRLLYDLDFRFRPRHRIRIATTHRAWVQERWVVAWTEHGLRRQLFARHLAFRRMTIYVETGANLTFRDRLI